MPNRGSPIRKDRGKDLENRAAATDPVMLNRRSHVVAGRINSKRVVKAMTEVKILLDNQYIWMNVSISLEVLGGPATSTQLLPR